MIVLFIATLKSPVVNVSNQVIKFFSQDNRLLPDAYLKIIILLLTAFFYCGHNILFWFVICHPDVGKEFSLKHNIADANYSAGL